MRPTIIGVVVLYATFSGLAGLPRAYAQSTPDSTGPQTAVPAPLPSGQADVPGGSARNGVIAPPATGSTMPIVRPPAHGRTPIIKPPTTTRNARPVQPK